MADPPAGRRALLRGAAGLATAFGIASRAASEGPVRGYPFTLGVASGDPLPDGVVLWTRLATAPLAIGGGMGDAVVPVAWELAADEGFTRILRRGSAEARPEAGHSVHVDVAELEPARSYWYRFRAMGEQSPPGRTRTAPAPGAMPPLLRFVNAGCQHYEHGFFTAWRHIAAEDLDFVFHYGDYIYEYAAIPEGQRRRIPAVRHHEGGECLTLQEYRRRYAQYRTDPDLQAAHAAHPFIPSFDDHEVQNNWAGPHSARSGLDPAFLLRRAAALRAWWENMPLRPAQAPRGADLRMHRRFAFGRLLDLHVLDTRQYRDPQPCNDGFRAPCDAVARPDAQMLGTAQEAWLLDGVARSRATWQVLGQQVMMMPRGVRGAISMDSWDGYPAARARLLDGLRARGARSVVMTGDVHSAWAGTIHADPADAAGPPVAAEFVATSISSEGDGSETRANTADVLAQNPHIAFFHARRGYTWHAATADRVEAAFRAVPQVTRPGAPLTEKARFVIEAGAPARLVRG